jgi:hypothetical protein
MIKQSNIIVNKFYTYIEDKNKKGLTRLNKLNVKYFSTKINKNNNSLELTNIFIKDLKLLNSAPESLIECKNFHKLNTRKRFKEKLKNKSGIYMFKYKHDNRIFYIGKSVNIPRRLPEHFIRSSISNNRLGIFLKTVG